MASKKDEHGNVGTIFLATFSPVCHQIASLEKTKFRGGGGHAPGPP